MARSYDDMPCRTCVGFDFDPNNIPYLPPLPDVNQPPAIPIDPNQYFTLDKNGARWDIFQQYATKVWTAQSSEYAPADVPFIMDPSEESLIVKVDAFAKTHTRIGPTGPSTNPDVPYKPIPSSPPVFGPPSFPIPVGIPGLPGVPGTTPPVTPPSIPTTPPVPIGMPNPLTPKEEPKKDNTTMYMAGAAAVLVAAMIFGSK